MNTVIFKTQDAIFEFDHKSVMERLERRKLSYDIQELDTLIAVLSKQTENAILSSAEHQYFGFIVLDLISVGEGSVVCKNCGKQYRFNQLETFTAEPYKTTLKAVKKNFGELKNLFRKRPKQFAIFGGKGIKCPEGHELIFMITWRT